MGTWLRVSHEDPFFVPMQGYLTRPRLSTEVINLNAQFIESAIDDGFDIDRQAQPRVITDVSGDICPFYLSDPNVVRVVGRRDQALDLSGRYSGELEYTPSARHDIRTYTSVPTRSHGIENESGPSRAKGLSGGVPSRAGRSKSNKNNPLKRDRDSNNNDDREDSGRTGPANGPNNRVGDTLACPYHSVEHNQKREYGCDVLKPFLNFDAQR